MAYPIEKKLVVTIASSALFALGDADRVFREEGEEAYRGYQREHIDDTLAPGVAFPFIKRLLGLNRRFPEKQPVEVVLLSKNDPDTGLRVFRSIAHYRLGIERAGFLSGTSPCPYLPAFNSSLFLSEDDNDVRQAIGAGFAAGKVLPGAAAAEDDSDELRLAFDFDGVIADDEAETVYKSGGLSEFQDLETRKSGIPHQPGPLSDFFRKISYFQKLERKRQIDEPGYIPALRTAIITARSAPAHERVVTTLREWGVLADETFFMGGVDKTPVLAIMKPHIFFDDQMSHLRSAAGSIPSVHVPFGVANILARKSVISGL